MYMYECGCTQCIISKLISYNQRYFYIHSLITIEKQLVKHTEYVL